MLKERLVLTENINDSGNSSFLYKGVYYPNKETLFQEMLSKIGVDKRSMVLVDRPQGTIKSLLRFKKDVPFHLSVVTHSNHYVTLGTNEDGVSWNDDYDYLFRHAEKVDSFICSTDAQSNLLRQQLEKYEHIEPNVVTIPAGHLPSKQYRPLQRDRTKFITVSSLSPEKKLDVLMTAFSKAIKESRQPLTLDIYGTGEEKTKLQKLIYELKLEHSVTLKGHRNMAKVYENYSTYLSASESEVFGLSLMEAIGAGLFMVGFDVPYGNHEFMTTEGGILVRCQPMDRVAVDLLAQAIVDSLSIDNEELTRFFQYDRGNKYNFLEIRSKWEDFLHVDSI